MNNCLPDVLQLAVRDRACLLAFCVQAVKYVLIAPGKDQAHIVKCRPREARCLLYEVKNALHGISETTEGGLTANDA
jgi:hypothetical protein